MPEKLSTTDIQQRMDELLDWVALRQAFIIARKGKPLIALVPVERLEQMRRFARGHALEVLARQAGGPLSDEQAMDLALEARRFARRHPSKQRDA